MIGVEVPIPVPMNCDSSGGCRDSLVGQSPVHGPGGVASWPRTEVVTERRPAVAEGSAASYDSPTSS
jgi:malonate-semialdehyde dehydrogenase (acetylating) / methylmalonate-semialdehyde dehydrogenase